MNDARKEEIIMATLKLASQKGLKGVSMSMIAESIGIKKPSLYNHFKSKEELVQEMYKFLREKAKDGLSCSLNQYEKFFEGKSACEILKVLVKNYIKMSSEKDIEMFYKVVYSERATSPNVAKIMVEETEKMINATTYVFKMLESKNLLKFINLEISAKSFALAIHSIMDYEADKSFSNTEKVNRDCVFLNEFIETFCREHSVEG